MKKFIHRISLDMNDAASQVQISAKYKDTARALHITLMNNGRPYAIESGCRAVISIHRPESTVISMDCDIRLKDSVIMYEFNDSTAQVVGLNLCEIKLYGEDGSLITSPRFTMLVNDNVFNDGDAHGSEYEFLRDRLNNLFSLTSETTPTEAELADIRVGYDGTVYGSAGDAVRGQINDVHEVLADHNDRLAEKVYVDSQDDAIKVKLNSKVEKSDVYSKDEIDAKGYLTEHQDISGKVDKEEGKGLSTNDFTDADKSNVDSIPGLTENVSDLTTELEYHIKFHPSGDGTSSDVTKGYVDARDNDILIKVANKADKEHTHSEYLTSVPEEYITESELDAKGYLTEHQDLSSYATKVELDGKSDKKHTHSEYLTSVPAEYITESELDAKGYLTEHQDLSSYAKSKDLISVSDMIGDGWIYSKTYAVDEYCIYNNYLWRCLVQHSGQSPVEGDYWTKCSVATEINQLNSDLANFLIQEQFTSETQAINSNGQTIFRITVSKDGYTPIGLVSYAIREVNDKYYNLHTLRAMLDGNVLNVYVRNSDSVAVSVMVIVKILYTKNL